MTREEARQIIATWLVSSGYIEGWFDEEDVEALRMAVEALNVKEHDGCDGCRYESNDEYMMPCANCRQNYMDRWTPMPQERCWIPCSERLPETPKHYYDRSLYLTCTKTGYITSIYWCDGWNCTVNEDGTVYREHEMKDIVAWMELPEPYKDGDIK